VRSASTLRLPRDEHSVVSSAEAKPGQLAEKLGHLKDAYDAQLISQEEYDAKRMELIDSL
jgi:hypothetical protein